MNESKHKKGRLNFDVLFHPGQQFFQFLIGNQILAATSRFASSSSRAPQQQRIYPPIGQPRGQASNQSGVVAHNVACLGMRRAQGVYHGLIGCRRRRCLQGHFGTLTKREPFGVTINIIIGNGGLVLVSLFLSRIRHVAQLSKGL